MDSQSITINSFAQLKVEQDVANLLFSSQPESSIPKKQLMIHYIDSFTDKQFTGNPCVCVDGAEVLTKEEMIKVAKETNAPETAFICNYENRKIKLFFFTPGGAEIPFCGHGTVAVATLFARQLPALREINFSTGVGVVKVKIINSGGKSIVSMNCRPSIYSKFDLIRREEISGNLDLPLCLVKHPAMYEQNTEYMYFVYPDLDGIKFNMRKAIEYSQLKCCGQFCLLSLIDERTIQMRGFSPQVGVDEDPFTGSALCGAITYLSEIGSLKDLKKDDLITVYQGKQMGRPGKAVVRILTLDPIKIEFFATSVYLGHGVITI